MSRLTGDRNSQQQQPQTNQSNQQIIQPIQQQQPQQTVPLQAIRNSVNQSQLQHQQQILTIPPSGSFIIINNTSNTNDGILRTPTNVVNTIQNSIFYSTPPSTSLANQNLNTNVSSITIHSTPTSHLDPTSPIAKKRLKLEVAENSKSGGNVNIFEDLSAIKKELLENAFQKLKSLKEK